MKPPNDIQMATSPAELAELLGPEAALVDPTFVETLAQIEADKKRKAADQAKLDALRQQPAQLSAAIIKKQPLQLKYQFVGQDSEGHEVKTLTMENEAGYFVSAYCLTCDKQLESLKVAKLPEPRVVLGEIIEYSKSPQEPEATRKIAYDIKKTNDKVPPKV